jgi:hypothetical protein
MSTTDTETTYRWFQFARDLTWAFTLPNTDVPKPDRIFERCLATPDVGTHLCEATVSSYVHVLDYYPEFDEDVSDEVREYWYDFLVGCVDEPGFYMHYADVFGSDGKPVSLRWQAQADDTEEDALEYARGNHLV